MKGIVKRCEVGQAGWVSGMRGRVPSCVDGDLWCGVVCDLSDVVCGMRGIAQAQRTRSDCCIAQHGVILHLDKSSASVSNCIVRYINVTSSAASVVCQIPEPHAHFTARKQSFVALEDHAWV